MPELNPPAPHAVVRPPPAMQPSEEAASPARASSGLTPERLALAQGSFFVATGVWPLLNLPSFQVVTGPKLEPWLVKGVGILITAIGGAVLSAAARKRLTPELIGCLNVAGLGLAALDLVYVHRRRIKPIYLADAVVELGFGAAWFATLLRR